MDAKRVVVVGGGFAGLNVAQRLADEEGAYDVTLIDRHPYTTFQPLLYQVATGGLSAGDITPALRTMAVRHRRHSFTFRRAALTGIDRERRLALVDDGDPLPYDHLVLAQGVTSYTFGIPGADVWARDIYTRSAAVGVRNLIFSGLEEMAAEPDPGRRFTVLVVGGGPTGVEMAGTLAELKSQGLPAVYPELTPDMFRVVLVQHGDVLLPQFRPRLQRYALRELRERDTDVRLGVSVREVRADHVVLSGGETLEADVVIWATGVGGFPEVRQWGLPVDRRNRILVDEHLRVRGEQDVYAVGDCADNPDDSLPQLAQPAIQGGRHVAEVIRAVDRGEEPPAYHYRDLGSMATIGRFAAVLESGRLSLTGFSAWFLWVVVHVRALLGGRNRLQTLVDLSFRYLSWPRSATQVVGDVAPRLEQEKRLADARDKVLNDEAEGPSVLTGRPRRAEESAPDSPA